MLSASDLLLPQSKLRLKKRAIVESSESNDHILQEYHANRMAREAEEAFAAEMEAERLQLEEAAAKKHGNKEKSKPVYSPPVVTFISAATVSLLFLIELHEVCGFLTCRDVVHISMTCKAAQSYICSFPTKTSGNAAPPSALGVAAAPPPVKTLRDYEQPLFATHVSMAAFARAVGRLTRDPPKAQAQGRGSVPPHQLLRQQQQYRMPPELQQVQLNVNQESRPLTSAQLALLVRGLPLLNTQLSLDGVVTVYPQADAGGGGNSKGKSSSRTPSTAPAATTLMSRPVLLEKLSIYLDSKVETTEIVDLMQCIHRSGPALKYLTHLSLEGSNIGKVNMQTLCTTFTTTTVLYRLKSLNLRKNNATCEGIKMLVNALFNNTNTVNTSPYKSVHSRKNALEAAAENNGYLVTAPYLTSLDISSNNADYYIIGVMDEKLFLTGSSAEEVEEEVANEDEEEEELSEAQKKQRASAKITADIDALYLELTTNEASKYSTNSNGDSYSLLFAKCHANFTRLHYNKDMSLRHYHCGENAMDLTDAETKLMIANKESSLTAAMLHTLDLSHNTLSDVNGLFFLKSILPLHKPIKRKIESLDAPAVTPLKVQVQEQMQRKQNGGDFLTSPPKVSTTPTAVTVIYNTRVLDLSHTEVGNKCADYLYSLCSGEHLWHLQTLNLSGNKITKVGLEGLLSILVPIVTVVPVDVEAEAGAAAMAASSANAKTKSASKRGAAAQGEEEDGSDDEDPGHDTGGSISSLLSSLATSFNMGGGGGGGKGKKPRGAAEKAPKGGSAAPVQPGRVAVTDDAQTIPVVASPPPPVTTTRHLLPHLRELNLSMNPLNNDGVLCVISFIIKGALDRLHLLDISNVCAGSDALIMVGRSLNERYLPPPELLFAAKQEEAARLAQFKGLVQVPLEDGASATAKTVAESTSAARGDARDAVRALHAKRSDLKRGNKDNQAVMQLRTLRLFSATKPHATKVVRDTFSATMLRYVKVS